MSAGLVGAFAVSDNRGAAASRDDHGAADRDSKTHARSRERIPAWYPRAVAIAIAGVLVAFALLRFLDVIQWVLYVLILALFASFALEPPVNWFVARGWRRGAATGFVIVLLLITGVVALLLVVPEVVSELVAFFGALPSYLRDAADAIGVEVDTTALADDVSPLRAELVALGTHLLNGVVQATAGLLGAIGQIFTVGLIAFYLVAEGPKFRRTVCSLLPVQRQVEVLRVWEISIEKMGGYLYSRLILAFASAGGVYVVLRLLELPYASSLAIWQGVISAFVPIIGTYIALALPLLVAILDGSPTAAIVLIVYEVAYQQFENYVLSPRISARRMQLHPAVAFVVAMIGSAVGGLIGAFLALPIGAIFQAVGSSIVRRHEVVDDELTRETRDEQVAARERQPSIATRIRGWVGTLGGSTDD
jgi:predicted PurR-regulated permease PerM